MSGKIGVKKGVSNWTFVFDDREVLIDVVQREIIAYICDERTEIKISNALVNDELLSLFRQGNKVKKVIQDFQIVELDGNVENRKWEYNDMEIKKMFIISQHDDYSGIGLLMCNY
jgi:hypothetical protein